MMETLTSTNPVQGILWTTLSKNIRQSGQVTERRCVLCGEWKTADFTHFPRNMRNYAKTHQVCLECVPSLGHDDVLAALHQLEIDGHLRQCSDRSSLRNDFIVHEDFVGIQAYDHRLLKYSYVVVDHDDWRWIRQYPGQIIIMSTGSYRYAYLRVDDVQGVIVAWAPTALHAMIARTGKGELTDHLNGVGLDNRKVNLRACLAVDNAQNKTKLNSNNRSGYRGVRRYLGGTWKVVINKKEYGHSLDYLAACQLAHDTLIAHGVPNVQPVPTAIPAGLQVAA